MAQCPSLSTLVLISNGFSSCDKMEMVFMNSDTDVTATFSELSQSSGEECTLDLRIDDFVKAKVHIVGSKDKTKHFIGKICTGLYNDGNFEKAFLKRSRKITNGFVFPCNENMSSICRKNF